MSSQPELKVSVVRDLDGVENLRGVWEELESTLTHIDPNANIDHFRTVVRTLDGVQRPHILVLEEAGVPVALVAARIDRERMPYKIGYKTIFAPKVSNLRVVYGGTLAADVAPYAELILKELIGSLARREADLITLAPQEQDSPLLKAAAEEGALTRDHYPRGQRHWRIQLPKSFDDYVASLSKGERKKVRKRRNRLEKNFCDGADYRRFREVSDVPTLMNDTDTIATQTYQRGMGVGFRNNLLTERRIFLAAEKGWLRSYVLYLNERPVAYQLGFVYGNSYYAVGRGFDREFSEHDVGTLLFEHALEQAIDSPGIDYWDFGIGDAPHKQRFSNESWEEISARVFASTFRGICLNLAWSSTHAVDLLARRLLSAWGDDIKGFWRNVFRRKSGDTNP